jgi:3-oxoacyl-[acyl-carrier-protein] synthase II
MGAYAHDEVFVPAAAAFTDGRFDGARFGRALRRAVLPLASERQSPGSLVARLARLHGLGGPAQAVMTACSGGTQAIGDGARWIRDGRAVVVLAGASDSEIYPMGLASFCLLGALSTRNDAPERASRPFDAGRDGFVLGEGAGFLVLEEEAHAKRRGASVLAEVAGFGSACDAWRVTDPHPEGEGAVLAMRRALAEAGLDPERVGWVNAHGTSTPANDRAEATALGRVFGPRLARLAVSSTKSMIGHLTVAAGAVEAIATVLALRDGVVHPTRNQETPDPECPLDTVREGERHIDLDAAISNSFAFGGQTACLAFRRART